MTRHLMVLALIVWSLAGATSAAAQGAAAEDERGREWTLKAPWGKIRRSQPVNQQKIDPFKVFDNVYYVGSYSVSSFMITTSDGLVLIDALHDATADMLMEGIRTLGFNPSNVKYIFITHSHADHYGGAGKIKAFSNARVGMSAEDWDVVEKARQTGTAIHRDLVLKEGQPLTLGDTTFKFYLTPGHTPGATSVEFPAKDAGKTYRALIPGGLGIDVAPQWTQPYISSIEKIRRLGPWDVLFGNHPFLAPQDLITMKADLANRGGRPHPLVLTQAQANAFYDGILKTAREKLASEQGK